MQKKFNIKVDCANCAAKIETAVRKIPGIQNASIGFMTQKMLVEADDRDFDRLMDEVVKAGKKIEPDFKIEL